MTNKFVDMLKKRLKKIFAHTDASVILIINTNQRDPNFSYVTQFDRGIFENSVLILRKDSYTLLTSTLEIDMAMEQTNQEVRLIGAKKYWETIKREAASDVVGVNGDFLPLNIYNKLRTHFKKIENVHTCFERARLIKEKDEIEKIKEAAGIVSRVADMIPCFDFKTENELAANIEYEMKRMGSSKPGFTTIVASGKNSALPHYTSDEKKIREGDFIVCDFGATCNNYISDITRTFFYERASRRKKKVYETVLNIQKECISAVRPGVLAKDVANIFYSRLKKLGYKPLHGLGHMVGVEVHDFKSVYAINSTNGDFILKPGMVFTIEPGIYIKDFGGVRIEDDILVTKNGCKVLTTAKKELGDIFISFLKLSSIHAKKSTQENI